jgi:hypothetical protein
MLMILFLVVMMTGKARNLQKIFIINLKCRYLENYHFFWDFRYVKATNESLFLKPSISEKC